MAAGIIVYPKKYAHGFCFAVLCCVYTLTDFPISIRLTSLALWQSNDCPSASKASLMNMDKYFMWIHYERLRNHNKAKHNKTVCIFLGIYCTYGFFWLHSCDKGRVLWHVIRRECKNLGIPKERVFSNSLRPRQNGRNFADDTFKRFFFNENAWISIKIQVCS